MSFNNQSALSYEKFLKHREYFDNSLILLLEKNNKQISKLKDQLTTSKSTIAKQKGCIKSLTFKCNDYKIMNYNLTNKLINNNEELEDFIKEYNKKNDELEKKIDNELTKSYEENNKLYEKYQDIKKDNDQLKKQKEELEKELEKLKKLLCKDSSNSSMPPSSDLFKTKKTISTREKSKLSVGGQKNHSLHKSSIKKPDNLIEKYVDKAPTGAAAIYNINGEIEYYVSQEIDLKFNTIINETRYYIIENGEKLDSKIMKKYKINPVSYADSFKSTILYLHINGFIALDRLSDMIKLLSEDKISLSNASIVNWLSEFNEKSEKVKSFLEGELLKSKIVHVDETGWKCDGVNSWLHVLANNDTILYYHTNKRTGKDDGPINALQTYSGYLVHDHFKPYYSNLSLCHHVECNAHVMRYLKAGVDNEKSLACAKLRNLLQTMHREVKTLRDEGKNKVTHDKMAMYKQKYHKIIDEELKRYELENPKIAKKYESDYIKLFRRLQRNSYHHLLFMSDFDVPFDNNYAERLIRPTKIKKKVSQQSKSEVGANAFASIFTILQTSKARKMNILKTIEKILKDENPFQ